MLHGVLQRHPALPVELQEVLVEGLHAVVVAFGDGVDDLAGARRVEQDLLDAAGDDHDLQRRDPAAPCPGDEALTDDPLQRPGERQAGLPLLVRRVQIDDPRHGVLGAGGVQGRDDEMAGRRGLQGCAGRLQIPHLADEDHVRVLAGRRAEGGGEGAGVGADLALVDQSEVVGVDDLDGILDGHDVTAPGGVDVADHRRRGRRLARPRGTGHEDQPPMLLRQLPHRGGQAQRVERRASALHPPQDQADLSELGERRGPEAGAVGQGVGEVGLGAGLEAVPPVDRHELAGEGLGVGRGQRRQRVDGHQLPVHPDVRRPAGLEVQVGSPDVDQMA